MTGLEVVQLDKGKGHMVLAPKGYQGGAHPLGGPDGFFEYWLAEAYVNQEVAEVEMNRKSRYLEYDVMDDNSSESSLTLDTYADESLASGRANESPINIKISDKKLADQVIGILKSQKILADGHNGFTAHRSHIRTLAKYGDKFHRYYREKEDGPVQIQRIRDPSLIRKIWEPKTQECLMYKQEDPTSKEKENLMPWEVCHYAIPDDQFHPYGRSILEHMRAPYKQLVINEALMALSRSSKVERLVIRVPTSGSNPASIFAQLLTAKGQMKNAIFGNDNGIRSKSRIAALTDILWMPGGKEYGIDRLQSNIDISSTDDVEYFRDKLLTATRLPKSYFLADETQRLEEGALAMQDLKFSRALLPLLYGYAEGLTWEITALLVMLGANLDKVKVEVSIDKPQSLSRAMVTGLDEAVQSVDALINSFNKATKGEDFGRGGGGGFGGDDGEPAPKPEFMDPEKWVAIMRAMTGMPYSLLHAIANIDKKAKVPDIPVSEQAEYILEETHQYTCTSDNVIQMWDASPRLIQEHQFKENWLKAA